jgi:hypothetical protein
MMYQYSEETLKKASEKLGRPISNEMFFMLRMAAHAYFRSKGRKHAEEIMGHTEIGRHNIKMLFGDKK